MSDHASVRVEVVMPTSEQNFWQANYEAHAGTSCDVERELASIADGVRHRIARLPDTSGTQPAYLRESQDGWTALVRQDAELRRYLADAGVIFEKSRLTTRGDRAEYMIRCRVRGQERVVACRLHPDHAELLAAWVVVVHADMSAQEWVASELLKRLLRTFPPERRARAG